MSVKNDFVFSDSSRIRPTAQSAMETLIGFIVAYLLRPRVLFSHVVSVIILHRLASESNEMRRTQVATTIVIQETVQLLLWLLLPAEGLAIALSLLFCIWLYDSADITSVVVYQTTELTTGQ